MLGVSFISLHFTYSFLKNNSGVWGSLASPVTGELRKYPVWDGHRPARRITTSACASPRTDKTGMSPGGKELRGAAEASCQGRNNFTKILWTHSFVLLHRFIL